MHLRYWQYKFPKPLSNYISNGIDFLVFKDNISIRHTLALQICLFMDGHVKLLGAVHIDNDECIRLSHLKEAICAVSWMPLGS